MLSDPIVLCRSFYMPNISLGKRRPGFTDPPKIQVLEFRVYIFGIKMNTYESKMQSMVVRSALSNSVVCNFIRFDGDSLSLVARQHEFRIGYGR
jgi:hypothetical protein